MSDVEVILWIANGVVMLALGAYGFRHDHDHDHPFQDHDHPLPEHKHPHEHELLHRRLDFHDRCLENQAEKFAGHDHPHEHDEVAQHWHENDHAHGKVAHQHDWLHSSTEDSDGRRYDIYRCRECDDRQKFSRKV